MSYHFEPSWVYNPFRPKVLETSVTINKSKKQNMKFKYKSPEHRRAEKVCRSNPWKYAPTQFQRHVMDQVPELKWKLNNHGLDMFYSAPLESIGFILLSFNDTIIQEPSGESVTDSSTISLEDLKRLVKLQVFA